MKIKKVAIIGLGYVGLPLATAASKKYQTIQLIQHTHTQMYVSRLGSRRPAPTCATQSTATTPR